MWLLMIVCIAFFASALLLIRGMTWAMYWRVMLAAVVSAGVCAVVFEIWLRRTLRRGEYVTELLHQISGGDLSMRASRIRESTRSPPRWRKRSARRIQRACRRCG